MKEKKKKLTLANTVVVICIAVSFVITLVTLWEYHRLDTVMPAAVVNGLLGMWLGELLTLAIRQIFGSDVILQARGKDKDKNNENYP